MAQEVLYSNESVGRRSSALVDTVTRLRAGQSKYRKLPLLQSVQISSGAHLASVQQAPGLFPQNQRDRGENLTTPI